MQRILPYFLLLSLILPIGGTWVWYQLRMETVKENVKQKLLTVIDDRELELLSFTEEEMAQKLEWEHASEFEYQGRMYDVVKREKKDNTYIFWCWEDAEETEIKQKYKKLLSQAMGNDPLHKKKNEQLVQFYNSLFITNPFLWTAPSVNAQNKELAVHYSNFYTFGVAAPPSAPPRLG